MKKSILLSMLTIFFCIDLFSQSNDPLIDSFLVSSEYNRIRNSSISEFGDADLERSNVFFGDMEDKIAINVILTKEGVFEGVVCAIPIPREYSNVLPSDEHYMMILYDYRNYDTSTKTGNIKLVDLNYDDWVPLEITVASGVVSDFQTHFMPDSIATKYSNLLKKRDFGNPIYNESTERETHYCDLNGNGNVTFGECFRCMASSCYGNSTCAFLCGITNFAGQILIGNQSCTLSMSLSCAWISIWY